MHVLRCEPGQASQLELVSFVLLRERLVATLPDFFVEEVRLLAAAARFVAPFAVLRFAAPRAEVFAPPRAEERAADFRDVFADVLAPFLAAVRFAPAFFAAVFLAPAFFAAPRAVDRAAVFLAAVFLAPAFLAAVFFAPPLFAAVFRAPAFLAAVFRAPAFLAAAFLAPAFLAPAFLAAFFAPPRAADFAAAFVDLCVVVVRRLRVFVSGVGISPVSPAIPELVSSIG
jgi:hypothetical protein